MLTTRFVATVKPTDTRTDYADAQVTGLCLRVTPQGAKSWSLRYRTKDGRPRRLTLGDADTVPLANARRLAKIALLHVAEGRDPMQERQDAKRGDTLDRLFDLYLEQHAKVKKRSWKDDERMYKAEWKRTLGAMKVKDIARRDVRRVLEAIVKRGSPITANRAQALIKVMLNFAVDQEWIGASPVSRMPKLAPERSRDRVLTHDEIRLLWRVSELEPPVYAAYTKLRLLTAQRGGELAKLKWSDFEADSFTIPAEISKNKQAHRVPLSKQAKAVLKTIPVVNDWVFPGQHDIGPMKDLRQATERIIQRIETAKWIQACERFDFRGHDLRRTAATLMASVGVPTEHISRVLNHAEGTPKVTAVYQRYEFDKEKRSALDALGREIDRILSGSLATTSHK